MQAGRTATKSYVVIGLVLIAVIGIATFLIRRAHHAPTNAANEAAEVATKQPTPHSAIDLARLDKNAYVVVDPSNTQYPSFFRGVAEQWTKPTEVYNDTYDNVRVYAGLDDITSLLESHPTEDWSRSKFSIVVLKDYRNAIPIAANEAAKSLAQFGITGKSAKKIAFIEESAFLDSTKHLYSVLGRKYIGEDGNCFFTTPEEYKGFGKITSKESDVMDSYVASGIVQELLIRQKRAATPGAAH